MLWVQNCTKLQCFNVQDRGKYHPQTVLGLKKGDGAGEGEGNTGVKYILYYVFISLSHSYYFVEQCNGSKSMCIWVCIEAGQATSDFLLWVILYVIETVAKILRC